MSQSHEMRIVLADDQGLSTNAISIAAKSCDLIGDRRFGSDDGKRGTRQRFQCGARELGEDVSGGFNLCPTADQLDWILERCMGDSIASFPASALVPKETVPPIYIGVDKGAKAYRYDLVYLNTLTFSFTEGDYVDLRVDCIGSQEVEFTYPVSPPAVDCADEFVAHDALFSLGVTAYPFKSLSMVFNNNIAAGQQENSLYRTVFESEGLDVSLNGTFGSRADTVGLYRRAIGGDAGTVTLDDGNVEYEFAFANVKIPGGGPTVPESGEITKSLDMMCYRTAATDVVTVTKS
jgi:hypothetical protein